jgi:hypothetical protein
VFDGNKQTLYVYLCTAGWKVLKTTSIRIQYYGSVARNLCPVLEILKYLALPASEAELTGVSVRLGTVDF